MLVRLRELLEWGTNISFFFTDFFFIRGTDFAEKEGLACSLKMLSPATLNEIL